MSTTSTGFIGLGRMGRGMAANLLAAGVPLTVYDRRAEPVAELARRGASPAASAAELASAVQCLFLCLPSEAEVEEVLFGGDALVARSGEGLFIVDTTTMNHAAALDIERRCREAGASYSDCPISGMPFRADNGTLTMMFGGSVQQFEQARPCLEVMGEFIVHCGALGAGQLMKAVNNIIYNVNIAALAEILPLAVKAGLEPRKLEEVLTTASARSFASEYFLPRILEGRFADEFPMQAAYKDIVNIEQLAERLNASMPLIDAMVSIYREAIDMGYGEEPKSAMIKVYEKRLGQVVRAD